VNKTLILFILSIFSFNTSLFAEEKKCSAFDVKCKVGNFISDTKDFQKKGANNSKEQLKKVKDKIKLPK
jgi:hypothetical protein